MANTTSGLALEACLRYVREREAFGGPIARQQVLRHRLADMATRLAASRALTDEVVTRLVAGETLVREVAMAKNAATDASDWITHQAVQVFGGAGYMRGTLVERLYRDSRVLSIGGGTREIMNEVICKQMDL
jgi:acyl-CoA dehydrogenase